MLAGPPHASSQAVRAHQHQSHRSFRDVRGAVTLDDLERGGPARQPGAVGDAEKAKPAAPSSGGNKLRTVLALLLAAAALALTLGLAVMPDRLPLTTATGREVGLLQADNTRQQAELDAAAQGGGRQRCCD